MNDFERKWQAYRDAVYPAVDGGLHPKQEAELKQAFFAGAWDVILMTTDVKDDKFTRAVIAEIVAYHKQRARELHGQEGRN